MMHYSAAVSGWVGNRASACGAHLEHKRKVVQRIVRYDEACIRLDTVGGATSSREKENASMCRPAYD